MRRVMCDHGCKTDPKLEALIDFELARLRASEFLRAFAAGLVGLRQLDLEFAALPPTERSAKTVRSYMMRSLGQCILMLHAVFDGPCHLPAAPSLLFRLDRALCDVSEGRNSPLLVTGDLADQLPATKYTAGFHRKIRAEAAAIVQILVSTGIEPTQTAAAKRVADSLTKGGYSVPGRAKTGERVRWDTVKRWHNQAHKGAAGYDWFETRMLIWSEVRRFPKAIEWVVAVLLPGLERQCRNSALADP